MQKKKKMFIPCARKKRDNRHHSERERERHIEREKGSGLFINYHILCVCRFLVSAMRGLSLCIETMMRMERTNEREKRKRCESVFFLLLCCT